MNTKTLLSNFLLIVLLIGGYLWLSRTDESTGKIFLQFSLEKLSVSSTQPIKLNGDDFLGKPILVNFWASWCEVCKGEEKLLNEFWKKNKTDIAVLGVVSRDTKEAVLKSGKLESREYPIVLDRAGKLAKSLGVDRLPQSFLFNSSGQLILSYKRPLDERALEEVMNQVKKRPEGKAGYPIQLSAVSPPQKLPEFSLTDSKRKKFSEREMHGRVSVVNFIFTSCQTMCPLLTRELKKIGKEFSTAKALNLVSISVDPKTDTPDKLLKYKKKNKIEKNDWYFLTGQWSSIRTLLMQGFKLGVPETPMFHTDRLVLVDREARVRGYYSANSSRQLKRLRKDLNYLLSN